MGTSQKNRPGSKVLPKAFTSAQIPLWNQVGNRRVHRAARLQRRRLWPTSAMSTLSLNGTSGGSSVFRQVGGRESMNPSRFSTTHLPSKLPKPKFGEK